MKIEIHTTREIKSEEFWPWAENLLEALNEGKRQIKKAMPGAKIHLVTREDFKKLWETGVMEVSDDLGYTKATTTYRIVEKI